MICGLSHTAACLMAMAKITGRQEYYRPKQSKNSIEGDANQAKRQ